MKIAIRMSIFQLDIRSTTIMQFFLVLGENGRIQIILKQKNWETDIFYF